MMVRYSAGMFMRISKTEETKYIPLKIDKDQEIGVILF
jgi:hypothetical protein